MTETSKLAEGDRPPAQQRQLDNVAVRASHTQTRGANIDLRGNTVYPVGTKRPAGQMEEGIQSERRSKRQAPDTNYRKSINTESRLALYQTLMHCNRSDVFEDILAQAAEFGDNTLAMTLHDCPPGLRLQALIQMTSEQRMRILELITDLEVGRAVDDPSALFPMVVTNFMLEPLLEISNAEDELSCLVCGDGFCKHNEKEKVDIENVIWKNCGNHMMHVNCFRSAVREGEMPLAGPCTCVGSS
ncbi:hypothetical protein FALBO_3665 [Fusarium albosuccineum]|uniref:Uncharacterized protein n=1 Tax=Fusarium albosuccineum TaxID=1237068 RepID=A0A8H4LJS4_9HYPO|nr:hypothetical protein FALBO_3665 [Fusarium albosuccineum]